MGTEEQDEPEGLDKETTDGKSETVGGWKPRGPDSRHEVIETEHL